MAPILQRRANSAQLKTWLIAVAVVASVVVTALIVYLIVFRARNKQYQEAAKRDPYLTRKEWARRRKLSNLERLEEEEVQRQLILRKTLTSRTSSRNDSIFEPRGGASSAEEPREGDAEKKWEAGYGADDDDCEGHPLIEQHPAVQGDEDQLPRSISPTGAPLQEHAPWRTSPRERRPSDPHNNPSLRNPSSSPPRAPPPSSTGPGSLIERPHIYDRPAHHPLRNSPSRHARSPGGFRRQSPSQPTDAPSADAQHDLNTQSTASPLHSRASSNPVEPETPNSARARSNSASTTPPTDLLSPPPPAALPHSASPRNDAFSTRELEQRRIPTQITRSLSGVLAQTTQGQAIHARARSHEMLPYHRIPSPSPARSPRRAPFLQGALGSKPSTSSHTGGTRAAVVSPAVSPVEEATLESERVTVSPGTTLLSDGSSAPFRKKEGFEGMSASDRDILPSQLQHSLQPDSLPSPPRQHFTNSEGDSQPSSFEGGSFFEGPQVSLRNLPAQPRRHPPSPHNVLDSPQPEQQNDRLDVEKEEEVGTAFSFEIGDQLKELGISVRRLPQRAPSPPAVASQSRQQEYEFDTEDEEVSSTFSFEEEDYLKELGVSIRNPATQRPGESPVLPPPQQSTQSTQYTDSEGEEGATFRFAGHHQRRGMGPPPRDPPPNRRNPRLAQLEIPRLSKDRSRSFEDRNVSQSGMELTPEVVAQRLRSRSFEPVAQGKWELQVSVLDQTGARHSRTSKEGDSDGYYSSASEPASPEERNTFNAEIPLAPLAMPSQPARGPFAGRRAPNPASAKSSPDMAHKRAPSTPLTSPSSDTSGLCRANFASPIKEKQLAEEQFNSRSPPASRGPFYSPSPASPPPFFPAPTQYPHTFISPPTQYPHTYVTPPMQSASTFASSPMQTPHGFVSPQTEAGWTVAAPGGWRDTGTGSMETDYGRDTMKEMWGSGPQTTGTDNNEKSKVSFRLSGPPDLMPAFF